MKLLIHACPARLWYVEEFLAPELERQGAGHVEIWNDAEGKENLLACMESFAACGAGTGRETGAPSSGASRRLSRCGSVTPRLWHATGMPEPRRRFAAQGKAGTGETSHLSRALLYKNPRNP